MSRDNRILLAGLVTAAFLPIVVGGILDWPRWTSVPLFVAVLVGAYRIIRHRPRTVTDHVGALLDGLGFHGNNPVRHLAAYQLAQLIEAAGRPRDAEQIRCTFDTLSPDQLPRSYRATKDDPREADERAASTPQ